MAFRNQFWAESTQRKFVPLLFITIFLQMSCTTVRPAIPTDMSQLGVLPAAYPIKKGERGWAVEAKASSWIWSACEDIVKETVSDLLAQVKNKGGNAVGSLIFYQSGGAYGTEFSDTAVGRDEICNKHWGWAVLSGVGLLHPWAQVVHVTGEAMNISDPQNLVNAKIRAAEGKAEAQYIMYLTLKDGKDENAANTWLANAATNGNVLAFRSGGAAIHADAGRCDEAMEILKKMKSEGENEEPYFKTLLKCADSGHAASQFELGAAYQSGTHPKGVDESLAYEWYQKAALQGHAEGDLPCQKRTRAVSKQMLLA